MERAGVTSTGLGGAIWRVGNGEGTSAVRTRRVLWALRAGVAARLTVVEGLGELFLRTILALCRCFEGRAPLFDLAFFALDPVFTPPPYAALIGVRIGANTIQAES